MLAPQIAAQESREESFADSIDVTVINLEAVVTDKSGNPVTDLRPEDFVLIVDGQEVPIEYFSEIREQRAVSPTPTETSPAPGEPEPAASAPAPSAPAGERVGINYLIFVDNYFSIPRDRNLVFKRVREELSALGPGDRVAIVAFDGRALSRVSDWSESPAQIAELLERATSERGLGAQRLGEQNLYEIQKRSLGVGLIGESDAATVEERIRQLSQQVEKVVRAATTTLRAVERPDGRKVMLLMSGGWPRDPATYVAGSNTEIRNRTLRFSPEKAFDELVNTANLLGYTLYPIDVPGRQIAGSGSGGRTAADRGDHIPDLAGGLQRSRPRDIQPPPRDPPPDVTAEDIAKLALDATENDFNFAGREHEVEASLLTIAEKTGGVALLNGQRQDALRRAIDDTGFYYWLGFSPRRQHDDRVHSVQVKVKNPKLEVRSRSSFKDLSRSTEAALLAEGELLFSTGLNEATLGVELGTLEGGRGKARLPVRLRIPLDEVVLLPTQNGYVAQLELRIAALDTRGNQSEMPVITVRIDGTEPPPPGAHAVYETTLEVRGRQKQRLVFSLSDPVSGKLLTATVEFDPG